MKYRSFGDTGIAVSEIALGGLLARYEGVCGHPSAQIKKNIYLEALAQGISLFDMGYGDEVYIPDELKGNSGSHSFALKFTAPDPDMLRFTVQSHLTNLHRDAIDILRIHHKDFVASDRLRETIYALRESGEIRSLCLIRHYLDDQRDYIESGPTEESDGDLVMYNYVCRGQSTGIDKAMEQGKGVLVMKALGGQWIGWDDKVSPHWSRTKKEALPEFAPKRDKVAENLDLIYPVSVGPWGDLAEAGHDRPRTSAAVQWALQNPGVSSVLVAVSSVDELEEVLDVVH